MGPPRSERAARAEYTGAAGRFPNGSAAEGFGKDSLGFLACHHLR